MEIKNLLQYKCVYMIGIGGISMSALAKILHDKGLEVRGYDRNDSPVVKDLRNYGIKVWLTDDAEAFNGVDLVCFTAAINDNHPQMILAKNSHAKIISRAELLGSISSSYANSVAVAGTHGKSTTSGLLSHIFMQSAHADPTVLVGAVLPEIDSTYRIGSDQNFIYEACEYKDSFLSFFPKIAVILNVELDHTDYFSDIHHIIRSFTQFANNTGKDGYTVVNKDCGNAMEAVQNYNGKTITFSKNGDPSADYYAKNIDLSSGFASFDVYRNGLYFAQISLGIPGEHNVSNALAAIAVADICGISKQEIESSIENYSGVKRRFEYIGSFNGARFYDDYAHHPDEIKATLKSAKKIAKGRVICAFQPHNYSRLRDLFDDFCKAFSDTDLLVLTKLYAPRETAQNDYTASLLAERTGATYIDLLDDLTPYLLKIAQPDDIIIYMGAGDIEKEVNNFKKNQN